MLGALVGGKCFLRGGVSGGSCGPKVRPLLFSLYDGPNPLPSFPDFLLIYIFRPEKLSQNLRPLWAVLMSFV